MGERRINRVIVIGAGFSAPAKLPIQNRIIEKMVEEPKIDFLSGNMPQESYKFLDSYIIVGLFLLDNYGKKNYQILENDYLNLCERRETRKSLEKIVDGNNLELKNKRIFMEAINLLPSEDDCYSAIYSIKNKVRIALKAEKINADLEEIFTSFDKSVISKEYLHKYTYNEVDTIRYSIMRLFVYYFSKGVIDHSFKTNDYLEFVKYLRRRRTSIPTTIITTNWDTLLEGYFDRYKIKYYYGFQSPYTSECLSENIADQRLLLLKIHGSANWLKCLHCGAISVYKDNGAAASLFEDNKRERCTLCGQGESFSVPSLQPEIITPTMLKSLTSRLYSNLWGTACSKLRDATNIIFIGYSFPIADFEFRYLLQKSISPLSKIDVVLYKNDDPAQTSIESLKDLLPEKRYRDTFPKNTITFYYDGFEKYFKDKNRLK